MINEAKELNKDLKNTKFVFNFNMLLNLLKSKRKKAIIFCSVLHEVPFNFYEIIIEIMKKNNCVIIRDMYFDNFLNEKIDYKDITNNSFISSE
jgi:hypothetical protein